jgi:hypothetical protein
MHVIERGTTGVPGTPLGSASIMWLKVGTYAILQRQFCGWTTAASDLTTQELLKWKNYNMESEEASLQRTYDSTQCRKGEALLGFVENLQDLGALY